MLKPRSLFLILLLGFSVSFYAQKKVKVACVGNSITYGHMVDSREVNAYPSRLQQLLGDEYEVGNFGKSGATLLNRGHRPYMQQEEYQKALAFAADRVVIHLGVNDTDPRDWPNFRDDFTKDYVQLIRSFREANPHCKVWICRLTPIFDRHPRFRSGTRDWYWQIQKTIENIAAHADVQLIDLQEPLYHRPDLLPDAVHPNVEGAAILAKTVYSALTGNYGGLQMPLLYSDNMVLQREKEIHLSGIANAGEKVTVKLAGERKTTEAAANGKWSVAMKPLKAGGPYELKIEAQSRKFIYNNVMVGEVWLCSGQSNMAFRVNQSMTREEDIAGAGKATNLRLFDMKPRWETYAVEWDASVLDSLNRLQYYKEARWTDCNANTVAAFSAVAYHFGKMLADSLNVPVGLIMNAVGGSPAEAWIDRRTLEFEFPDILVDWKNNDMIQDWARGRAALNVKKSANKQQRHPYEPCYLYESGIIPLEQYPLRGVIWYQGESNAHNIEVHEKLFPLLVDSWRRNWQEEDMPFYYVQLSGIDRPTWAWFRDSQRRLMQRIPHTGMAVCSDRGDSLDVHPRHKKEVGERLARWALQDTYQKTGITPSGPLYRSVEFKKGAAFLSFDYDKEMHASDGKPLRTFEIAGTDELFYPAIAEVQADGKIKVRAKEVARPVIVRYGWQPFTRANLVNGDELPASTFRTDR